MQEILAFAILAALVVGLVIDGVARRREKSRQRSATLASLAPPVPNSSPSHSEQYWKDVAAPGSPIARSATRADSAPDPVVQAPSPLRSPDARNARAQSPEVERAQDKPVDDDDYEAFVEMVWRMPAISMGGRRFERTTWDGESRACEVAGLVRAPNGKIYINANEDGVKKTYLADNRHRWTYAGHPVDDFAFHAIVDGVSIDRALAEDRRPSTIEEALDPANNRIATADHQYVIGYRNADGDGLLSGDKRNQALRRPSDGALSLSMGSEAHIRVPVELLS